MRIPLLACVLLSAPAVFAAADPAFEVATVKPSEITAGSWARFLPGGRLSAASWLKQLIQIAYGVEDYQVSGGPGWLTTQWYEIEAKSPNPNADRKAMLLMLRTLLEERFQLKLRQEEKEFPVFALKIDKNGAKLPPLADGEKSKCTRDNSFVCGIRTPAELGKALQYTVGKPVLDRTGVSGRFDILLDFDVYATRGQDTPAGYDKPSLAAALRDQLGLRMEPEKIGLPVLIVEKAERPGAN